MFTTTTKQTTRPPRFCMRVCCQPDWRIRFQRVCQPEFNPANLDGMRNRAGTQAANTVAKVRAGFAWKTKVLAAQGIVAGWMVWLWKSRCISTGPDVQNDAFPVHPKICPVNVQSAHTPCTAGKPVAKSLILWSKRELSTEVPAFTIYYQFLYTP
ncbi:hypothetical protein [Massilia consociata]|uniref:hypothetical protein n=1 Tax=Massilia consociata TaxID=760117 RepID=UPI0036D3F09C